MSWAETDLIKNVRDDLRRYLGISKPPLFTRVYRMPRAGVQLDVGHLDLIAKAEATLRDLPGLYVSAAGLRGVGIADCAGDARAQAIALADYVRCRERHYASAAGS